MSEGLKEFLGAVAHILIFSIFCFSASYFGWRLAEAREQYFFVTITEKTRKSDGYAEQRFVLRSKDALTAERYLYDEFLPQKEKNEGKKWLVWDIKKI